MDSTAVSGRGGVRDDQADRFLLASRRLEGYHAVAEGLQLRLTIESEQEEGGRWLAEVCELPGVLAYGPDREAAIARVQALALRVLADRLEHGEATPGPLTISFAAARTVFSPAPGGPT